MDFQLRGPGDLFGTQQHGLPPLRIADLRRDQAVLDEARSAAKQLFAADPGLAIAGTCAAAAANACQIWGCARFGGRRIGLGLRVLVPKAASCGGVV